MKKPVSWADIPKEWLDKPKYTIRKRAFYRATRKLTSLGLIHQVNPKSYPASWVVGDSAPEKKAADDYLVKRQWETVRVYSTGKNLSKPEWRKNTRIKAKAFKILRQKTKTEAIPSKPEVIGDFKPVFYSLDYLKEIYEEDKLLKRINLQAEQWKAYGRRGSLSFQVKQ
jgi:hypothetical protein